MNINPKEFRIIPAVRTPPVVKTIRIAPIHANKSPSKIITKISSFQNIVSSKPRSGLGPPNAGLGAGVVIIGWGAG